MTGLLTTRNNKAVSANPETACVFLCKDRLQANSGVTG